MPVIGFIEKRPAESKARSWPRKGRKIQPKAENKIKSQPKGIAQIRWQNSAPRTVLIERRQD
jgi:hypothetical protein